MTERAFIIQRYCSENWPQLRGQRPFIAAGPKFHAYTTNKSKTLGAGEGWRFGAAFRSDIASVGDAPDQLSREIIGELLLREGIVQALWQISSIQCLPEEEQWQASIEQVAREIPAVAPLAEWVIEMLSGLTDAAYLRSYVSTDQLELKAVEIPSE